MTDPAVLVSRVGALGRIHLNRPEALNSLTLEMIRPIGAGLDRSQNDSTVQAVTLTVTGDKALCAGGDIKLMYRIGRSDPAQALNFWAEEYRLAARIARFAKPLVAVMDGLVIGGGVGICIHESHRIVTKRTKFALPETGIGYFPDVGSTFSLSHSPDELGTWIGLTDATIRAGDVMAAGLADAMVPSNRTEALLADLAALGPVVEAVAPQAADPGPSDLRENAALIGTAFAGEDLRLMLDRLAATDAP